MEYSGARVDKRIVDGVEKIIVIAQAGESARETVAAIFMAKRHARELGLSDVELQIPPAVNEQILRAQAKRARRASRVK